MNPQHDNRPAELAYDLSIAPSLEACEFASKYWEYAAAVGRKRAFENYVILLDQPFIPPKIKDNRTTRKDYQTVRVWQDAPLNRDGATLKDMDHKISRLREDLGYAHRIYDLHRIEHNLPIMMPNLALDGLAHDKELEKEKQIWIMGTSYLLSCPQGYFDGVVAPNLQEQLFVVSDTTPMPREYIISAKRMGKAIKKDQKLLVMKELLPENIMRLVRKYKVGFESPDQHESPKICLEMTSRYLNPACFARENQAIVPTTTFAQHLPYGWIDVSQLASGGPSTYVPMANQSHFELQDVSANRLPVGMEVDSISDDILEENCLFAPTIETAQGPTAVSETSDWKHYFAAELLDIAGPAPVDPLPNEWYTFPQDEEPEVDFSEWLNEDVMAGLFDVESFPAVESSPLLMPTILPKSAPVEDEQALEHAFNPLGYEDPILGSLLLAENQETLTQNGGIPIENPLIPDYEDYFHFLRDDELDFMDAQNGFYFDGLWPAVHTQEVVESRPSEGPESSSDLPSSGPSRDSNCTTPLTSNNNTPFVLENKSSGQYFGTQSKGPFVDINEGTAVPQFENAATLPRTLHPDPPNNNSAEPYVYPGQSLIPQLQGGYQAPHQAGPSAKIPNNAIASSSRISQEVSNKNTNPARGKAQEQVLYTPEKPLPQREWDEATWEYHTPPYAIQYNVKPRTCFVRKQYRGAVPRDPSGIKYIPEEFWASEYCATCVKYRRYLTVANMRGHQYDGYTKLTDMERDGYIRRKTIDMLMSVRLWLPADYVDHPGQWND